MNGQSSTATGHAPPQRRPQPYVSSPPASAEEAAAVVAAVEEHVRATAPPAEAAADERLSAWRAEALREGVDRWPQAPSPGLWR